MWWKCSRCMTLVRFQYGSGSLYIEFTCPGCKLPQVIHMIRLKKLEEKRLRGEPVELVDGDI